MVILVQETKNERFLTAGGGWSASWADAVDFNSAEQARTLARKNVAGQFRVMLYFPFTGCFVPTGAGTGRAQTDNRGRL